MRRLPAVAAVAVALFATAVAGCSGGSQPTAAPGGTAGPASTGAASAGPTGPAGGAGTPAPGTPQVTVTATAGGNAGQVCDAAVTAGSEAAVTFVNELSKQLQASSAGDAKTAETARQNAQAALNRWSAALKQQSDRATDAQLKAALAAVGIEVSRIKPDVQTLDQTKLNELQQRVDGLCGN
ncbi:hypothetical protein ACFFWC_10050 [Plantactinospora siamensis]|uniref:Lipoprotein n=1 Tax=Plantactinospora siamensis TaxID=555372 RepID=A0ABV6NUI1_9ACTN